jgi:hypothetical protein
VVLRQDADGTMYPIKKVKLDEMILRNFKWLDDLRPKTKYELFENELSPQKPMEDQGLRPKA